VTTEATVIAVAALLYLADCVVLIERGQALWSRGALAFGSVHYQLRGKAVALLHPLTPFAPVFRTQPLFSVAPGIPLPDARQAVAPAAALGALQFLLLFAALPYCLLRAPGWPFLVSLLLAYLNALAMLGLLWRRLRRAGIAARPLAGLAFGWLACLPLSVNAARKAGLAFDIDMDARRAVQTIPMEKKPAGRFELAAQVAEAMQELDEDDERYRRLAELKRRLTTEAGDGRT
jgi:hypothetical protein